MKLKIFRTFSTVLCLFKLAIINERMALLLLLTKHKILFTLGIKIGVWEMIISVSVYSEIYHPKCCAINLSGSITIKHKHFINDCGLLKALCITVSKGNRKDTERKFEWKHVHSFVIFVGLNLGQTFIVIVFTDYIIIVV